MILNHGIGDNDKKLNESRIRSQDRGNLGGSPGLSAQVEAAIQRSVTLTP
jgi:hypothetical protein